MIEEMQEQEAEFLKEQKEKKLKNRRLSAFLETFHSMFKLPKFQRCCYITVVHLFQGAFFFDRTGQEHDIGWRPCTVPSNSSLAERFGMKANGLTCLVWDEVPRGWTTQGSY